MWRYMALENSVLFLKCILGSNTSIHIVSCLFLLRVVCLYASLSALSWHVLWQPNTVLCVLGHFMSSQSGHGKFGRQWVAINLNRPSIRLWEWGVYLFLSLSLSRYIYIYIDIYIEREREKLLWLIHMCSTPISLYMCVPNELICEFMCLHMMRLVVLFGFECLQYGSINVCWAHHMTLPALPLCVCSLQQVHGNGMAMAWQCRGSRAMAMP